MVGVEVMFVLVAAMGVVVVLLLAVLAVLA